ncbi:MAG TPA: hypothetical protein PKA28_05040 [Methylomusa anaerophila]|uniref:O-GlcNAc transferase C-terminal domain-containing protein n=1 Tax=Methylomusa anaerophila TaxID=1930071 RepID=A0A348AM93_9FIRM|nr:hypothetical protein [Methylomusa anaerophila]BBB92191.1 hypothetical protein MAMMFC1_02876 [Methylomusa anaerophila]HML87795.1 hypothetical protein [Methylomusa anaerophila]
MIGTDDTDTHSIFDLIIERYKIAETIQAAQTVGWDHAWKQFDEIHNGFDCQSRNNSTNNTNEKTLYVDLFFGHCLKCISSTQDYKLLWEILYRWFTNRKLEQRNGAISDAEKISLLHFCVNMRVKLQKFFAKNPPAAITGLPAEQQRLMISIWRQIFLEPFSALNLYWTSFKSFKKEEINVQSLTAGACDYYSQLIIASMYQPFAAGDYAIDAQALVRSALPFCYKTSIMHWMVNIPYFNAEERHRQKLLRYVPDLCHAIKNHPAMINTNFFLTFVQEVMTGFWRASYIGGNNIDGLAAFGDFISHVMNKFMPCPKPKPARKLLGGGEKLRIGYISRNFYKQAVSCYMVNRVIHHDRNKFEVYVYALGDYHDEISDLFKNNCQYFERIENMMDFSTIIQNIINSKLDILIYPDIGMDPVTYILSGLQLAPVQCALVGHGTTTGMPTIQYYISGDFEPPNARHHYREKIVKLPNLGAAQYLPSHPEDKLTREDLGLPADAVVFISCANGIKHGHLRDRLFVEILKKAPNAWVVLKPFATHASIDRVYSRRIAGAAKVAGVGDRLLLLPPLGHSQHVMGILSLADVQLDTYPYGGWTTNMEALYMGLPIVTQEGELARSRWGAGMLRALGITEGIAANEEEYVDWAVRLAQDAKLRRRLSTRIKARVKKVLFNGPIAQRSYEEALIKIHEETLRQTETVAQYSAKKFNANKITVATSLSINNTELQQKALTTWLNAGFHIASLNILRDIAKLKPKYPDIEFIAAAENATSKYGNSYLPFHQFLEFFSSRDLKICGIISPDIHLTRDAFYEYIQREADGSMLYGSRVDVEHLTSPDGEMYQNGFDYFFFDKSIIQYYPHLDMYLGLPWCDYWIVLTPLMRKLPVKQVTTPVARHVKHRNSLDSNTWQELGMSFARHFRPPFDLSPAFLPKYAKETWAIINHLSQKVSIE